MKNKGFTLIELLAVIVILAIIALIATPIVINMIGNAKDSSDERSAELYLDAVEQAVARKNLTEKFSPSTCDVQSDGNLKCDGDTLLEVQVENAKPTGGTIKFENGRISDSSTLIINGKTIEVGKNSNGSQTNAIATAVKTSEYGNVPSGSFEKGDEYIVEVNDSESVNFYVLSVDGDNVNLIAKDDELVGRSAWGSESTKEGPHSVFDAISKKTSSWTNIPNITIKYTSDYYDMTTVGNVTTIYGKDSSENKEYTDLKARLPYKSEVSYGSNGSTACDNSECKNFPKWLYDISKGGFGRIRGYWTMDSGNYASGTSIYGIYTFGELGTFYSGNVEYGSSGNRGVIYTRPVITLKKSQFK